MKSAYERALEKLEADGIERPREDALSDRVKAEMAEVRRKAEAKIAELEIMHRKSLDGVTDPGGRLEASRSHRAECRRIEAERDERLERLRRTTEP